MDWLGHFQEAIGYIEDHLTEGVDMNRLAQIARCSAFHFQRMFSYLADLPLSEYIRRRKMTKAAFDLCNSKAKILDIALKYGYDSPTAFNRAFQAIHGIPPSAARETAVTLKAYPPIHFHMTIKGDAQMNYRIENKEAFRTVGIRQHYPFNLEENFLKIPLFWQQAMMDGRGPALASLINQPPFGLLGISACMNGADFDYYIAAPTDQDVPAGFETYEVPACTWAIFDCVGALPNAIQDLQKRILTEWLPTSGYEYANAPDIEVYSEGNQQSEDYRCEVWLPIQKAEK